MNGIYEAALEVQQFCAERQWRFCFIGGLALIRWGEPRQTKDADMTLLTGFENEESYIEELLRQFESRHEDAIDFALKNRVLLLRASDGVPIDISLAGLPFEERMIRRGSDFRYLPAVQITTASAEDLVILKAFAGRARDWADIESILIRRGEKLDWSLIVDELTPLCELKESPETVDRLLALRDQMAAE